MSQWTVQLRLRHTGNDFKLNEIRANYDLRKYFFTNGVVNIWNSLLNYVITAESVNSFKSRLDKFWKHQRTYV